MRVKDFMIDASLAATIGALLAVTSQETTLPPHDPLVFGNIVDAGSETTEPWGPHPFEREYETPGVTRRSADIAVSSTSGHAVKPPAGAIGFSGYPPTVKVR